MRSILELLSREFNPNTNWIESMFMIMPTGIEGYQGFFTVKSFLLRVNATETIKVKLETMISCRNLCVSCNQNKIELPKTLIVEVLNPTILVHCLDFNIQSKTCELVSVGFDNQIKIKNIKTTNWYKYIGQFTQINSNSRKFTQIHRNSRLKQEGFRKAS